jgi:hypothetical protein
LVPLLTRTINSISIPQRHEPFLKNPAQAPWSATHHPRSVVQILTNSDRRSPITARAPEVFYNGPRTIDALLQTLR